jgi:hypothetical protein
VEQTDLRTRRTSIRLAFADHVNGFVTGDGAPSSPEGAKMLTRADPAFDCPMILFQNIVEILHRSMSTVLLQSDLGFELYDGWRVSIPVRDYLASVLSRLANVPFNRIAELTPIAWAARS